MDLNVKIEEVSPVKKKLSFEIPWEEVRKELDSAYKKIGKKAKVKGFRPGRTPRKLLETYYKVEAEGEAINNMINKQYRDVVDKKRIFPTAQPEIDEAGIQDEKDYVFSVTVETKPAIEPQGYTDLELEREDPRVTEDQVTQRIEEIRQMYGTLEDIPEERAVESGDFVSIDFQGMLEGKVVDDMKGENYLLEIGSKRFVPGFEEQLTGMHKGETKEFKITFPETYSAEDLRGKEVSFTTTVKEIKIKRVPELDENFLKNFEKYETVDQFKEEIKKSLAEENKSRVETQFKNKLVDILLEKNIFDIPPTLVEKQLYMMMINAQQRMAYNGLDAKKAAELSYSMRDRIRIEAEKMVRTSLLLEAIAEKESINVDEQDREKRFAEIAARYTQDVESVKSSYEKEGMMENFAAEIVEQKTLDFIERRAKIKITDPKPDAL